MPSMPLRLAAVMRGRARGGRRRRPPRLRQLRPQPRGLARGHGHEHRLREPPCLRLFRGGERRRHEDREALRDARRNGAAPLGLVARDVQGRRGDQDHGRAGSLRRELVLRLTRSCSPTARRPIATRSSRSRPATAAPAAPRAARLPSGEPNITGDWAPEQVVMTDPRGRSGALVPVSRRRGASSRGEATDAAGRRASCRGRAARDLHRGRQGGSRRVPQRHDRQPAHALRDDEHPVRLDVRRPRQSHHAERRHDHAAVRPARLHAHDPHEHDGASRRTSSRPARATRSAAGRTTCSSSTRSASRPAC